MTFQQMGFNREKTEQIFSEIMKICKEYDGCVGCPFINGNTKVFGEMVQCETGKRKQNIR